MSHDWSNQRENVNGGEPSSGIHAQINIYIVLPRTVLFKQHLGWEKKSNFKCVLLFKLTVCLLSDSRWDRENIPPSLLSRLHRNICFWCILAGGYYVVVLCLLFNIFEQTVLETNGGNFCLDFFLAIGKILLRFIFCYLYTATRIFFIRKQCFLNLFSIPNVSYWLS